MEHILSMYEKQMMSHTEQKIYFSLTPGKIYDVRFIKQITGVNAETLSVLLSKLAKKGWITRLKKGVYFINYLNKNTLEDIFIAAQDIFNGYIGFSSALYLYGAVDEFPSVIYVCTAKKSSSITVNKIELRAVSLGKRATGMVVYKDYFVSSKAKTLYDCFYKPELSGGYSTILSAVPRLQLTASDWREFIFYVEKFGNPSFSRKAGFLLELLSKKIKISIPDFVFSKLNVGNQITKLGSGKEGKFIKKWKLVNYVGDGDLFGRLFYG